MTAQAPASGKLKVILGVRPEQITISRTRAPRTRWRPTCTRVCPQVRDAGFRPGGEEKLVTVKELGSTHYSGDETVYISFDPKKINVFDAASEELIKYSR
ncbi:hypothetical protein [Dysosmobacter welbionis]|uniref:hypothetical protein n=1 Tax=Dysosmobacter welbionis TaxID=2093857 RepID=UPI0023569CA4|nr:hypothetical protein [Dysosmobacter welbionis]